MFTGLAREGITLDVPDLAENLTDVQGFDGQVVSDRRHAFCRSYQGFVLEPLAQVALLGPFRMER